MRMRSRDARADLRARVIDPLILASDAEPRPVIIGRPVLAKWFALGAAIRLRITLFFRLVFVAANLRGIVKLPRLIRCSALLADVSTVVALRTVPRVGLRALRAALAGPFVAGPA